MTGSLTVGYLNDTSMNFLLTSSVCLSVCLYAFVISCTLDLGYIFQQVGASPWLGLAQGWSGSAKIRPVSQLFMSVQHNFCPFEFHPLQSLTKAGHSTIFLNSCIHYKVSHLKLWLVLSSSVTGSFCLLCLRSSNNNCNVLLISPGQKVEHDNVYCNKCFLL